MVDLCAKFVHNMSINNTKTIKMKNARNPHLKLKTKEKIMNRLHVVVDEELYQQIEDEAKARGWSKSLLIREILKESFNNNKGKNHEHTRFSRPRTGG